MMPYCFIRYTWTTSSWHVRYGWPTCLVIRIRFKLYYIDILRLFYSSYFTFCNVYIVTSVPYVTCCSGHDVYRDICHWHCYIRYTQYVPAVRTLFICYANMIYFLLQLWHCTQKLSVNDLSFQDHILQVILAERFGYFSKPTFRRSRMSRSIVLLPHPHRAKPFASMQIAIGKARPY